MVVPRSCSLAWRARARQRRLGHELVLKALFLVLDSDVRKKNGLD